MALIFTGALKYVSGVTVSLPGIPFVPSNFINFGRITEDVTESENYNRITDSVTLFDNYGLITVVVV